MYIIIGNGESRSKFDLNFLNSHITFGCNALYRDYSPTILVSQDADIMFEIVSSGYSKEHKCFFKDYMPMDAEHYAFLKASSVDVEVVENDPTYYKFAFFGKNKQKIYKDGLQYWIDAIKHYYIWTNERDQIEDLSEWCNDPIDSGILATKLCCLMHNPKDVYLLGFDFGLHNGLVNNIYKSTNGYAPDYALPVPSENWEYSMQHVMGEFPDVRFVHVQEENVFKHIDTISLSEFEDIIYTKKYI